MSDQYQTTIETAMANAVCPKVATDHVPTASDKPTIEAIIKRCIKWAFVPSKRRYTAGSHALKHEVERDCRTWDIRECYFRRAMTDAGFRSIKDNHYYYFYVADSPSRNTYFRELQSCSGPVPHPLDRPDPTTEFNKLSSREKQQMSVWIYEYVTPRKRKTNPAWLMSESCCGAHSGKRYAAFCGAMLAVGYPPVNLAACHWRFRVGVDWVRVGQSVRNTARDTL